MKTLITSLCVLALAELSLQFYPPPFVRKAAAPTCRQVPQEVCKQVPRTTFESVSRRQCRDVQEQVGSLVPFESFAMIKSVLISLQPRPGLRQRPGAEVRRGAAAGAADRLPAAVQQAGQGELQTGGVVAYLSVNYFCLLFT